MLPRGVPPSLQMKLLELLAPVLAGEFPDQQAFSPPDAGRDRFLHSVQTMGLILCLPVFFKGHFEAAWRGSGWY